MFNQMEMTFARLEYQQMLQGSASALQDAEVAAKSGLMRRLLCVFECQRLTEKKKAAAQRNYPHGIVRNQQRPDLI